MSVLLETSAGDVVIDLLVDYAPKMCENFLKLCKVKYYNFSPIHSVQKSFSFQTGDPLGPMAAQSDGGTSIWGLLSDNAVDRTFTALFHPKLKHLERGTVSMATAPHPSDPDQRLAGSQFIVTLGDNTDYLNGKAAIFGKVVEGFDVLEKINDAIIDERGHPLVDIRIKHTVVLDDPYPDPPGLREPSSSPAPTKAQLATVRIAEDEELLDEEANEEAAAEAEKRRKEREAAAQALTLEMMGDLPFAEVKPPENVLFVCKLNPVTTDDDLELIFSRFGKILSCEVIRDQKTGDSLQYAFIEFEDQKSCEDAYSKMDSVLIDDRRIHVDFSQSVSRLSEVWRNDTNTKRKSAARRGGGGWGGVKELEKRRQYRNQDVEPEDDRGYRMVHGMEDIRGRHGRDEDIPRGGPSKEATDRGEGANRRAERSPERYGDEYRPGPVDRKRDTERRSRSPRRDRYRDHGHDRPAPAGRRRDDREWSRRDRRDPDRDRGSGKDRDRYRGRDDYGGR
ncbi:cyclophilin-like domain-containing protein [Chaetomium fimeti]|uniref:Peptidyl-prolyl cis-trans isomerase n=1 Tax=Chaetomium fimeti TaxID=1854472 RepID=A0AAE0LT62_9PEZI|nr:cyclophilin-like domain-containing protein [Chaetomium fimeti]